MASLVLEDNSISIKTINEFKNNLERSLFKLEKYGYNINEIYRLYLVLYKDILNDERLKKFSNDELEQLIKKLNIYNSLLIDLIEALTDKEVELDEINMKFKSIKENKPVKIKNNNTDWDRIIATIASILSAATIITSISVVKNDTQGFTPSTFHLTEHFDNLGNSYEDKIRYNGKTNTLIIDYSEYSDGYRTKTTYNLGNKQMPTVEELSTMDLTSLEKISTEQEVSYIYPKGSYRVCETVTEVELSEVLLCAVLKTMIVLIAIELLSSKLISIDNDDIILFEEVIYHDLIDLAKYKIAIRKYIKELNLTGKDKEELSRSINVICQRIEKTVNSAFECISQLEEYKKYKKVNETEEIKEMYEKKQKEIEDKRVESYKNIKSIIDTLSKELSYYGNLDENQVKNLLHTISISSDILFEKENDHLKIKSMFIPILKFLDLSLISFDNVDIRYIDFRESNARVNLRKIYNLDASYAKFDDENIADWSNYTGINLTGSLLSEDENTMIGLEGAIISKDTIITGKNVENNNGLN